MIVQILKEKARVRAASLFLLLLLQPAVYTQTKGTMPKREFVIALHTSVNSDKTCKNLIKELPGLQKRGINTLFLSIGNNYQWKCDPKLYSTYGLSESAAREIAAECCRLSIDLIPEINCIGHQSWKDKTFGLLKAYPELDETPGLYPGNKGIYCRSLCTSNEKVYRILFALIDEITEVLSVQKIHVGLDEVFLIGEDACPLCRGKDKAELFAGAVNKLYDHCVKKRGFTMYMWGDRLLDCDDEESGYKGEYESSCNGTAPAVDHIPKDIIICDWHYDELERYGSIPFFLNKGFRVLPTSYKDIKAVNALIDYSLLYTDKPAMLGHLYTAWDNFTNKNLAKYKPIVKTVDKLTGELSNTASGK
ncbi:family 20 glycosylhydrolase [Treponema sp. OMZ 840]|uniref:family 20 glycosylhydrolase n=1 Tax=Treponema sp. OMZ 840 TaxID=244313 RepID=UPI003D8D0DBC